MDFPLLGMGLSIKISFVPGKTKKKKAWQVLPGVKIFVNHSCYFGMSVEQWISHSLVWSLLSTSFKCIDHN
jgi:hypothetical protein